MHPRTQPQPQKQHVVPACYLAGFTHQREPDTGRIWVTDKSRRKQWETSPRNAARHTDFYTADFGSDVDSYGVEKGFSHLEGKWEVVLRRIIETSKLPADDTEEFADLMGFVAFQAMRTPSTRDYVGELMDEWSKAELVARLTDGSDWEGFIRYMRDLGEPVTLTRGELLESAKQGEFVVTADKTWTIQTQLRSAIVLMLHLSSREWSLFGAEDGASDFVCSDSPVCVTSSIEGVGREQGYCNRRSVVTIPLGRRHALAGFYEGQLDMVLPECEIAGVNAMTLRHCNQVYAASPHFRYAREDGQIGNERDFLG